MSEVTSIATAMSPAERFREYLVTQGKRLTQEKSKIVEEVFASHEHFDADQLIERLSKKQVSRSTVYRALAEMEAAGLLRKVARTNDKEIYEHDYGYTPHDHLICKKCGTLIEFPLPDLQALLDEIARQHGFRMESHRLEVYGQCQECSRPPKRPHRKTDMI